MEEQPNFGASSWPTLSVESFQWYAIATDEAIDSESVSDLKDAAHIWPILRQRASEADEYSVAAYCAYCEGNVFSCLANIAKQRGEDNTNYIERQTTSLLRAFLLPSDDDRFESALRCNYANLLSDTGRHSEALYQWEESIRLDLYNYAARLSFGQGCERMARKWPEYGWHYAEEAFTQYRIISLLDPPEDAYWDYKVIEEGRSHLDALIRRIESTSVTMEQFHEAMELREVAHAEEPEDDISNWLARERLFLTIAPDLRKCPFERKDTLRIERFGVMTHSEAVRFADLFNGVREDFAFTRSLITRYCKGEPDKTDGLMQYLGIDGGSKCGLDCANAKAAIRSSVDGTERIGKILISLLQLQDDNTRRAWSFNNLWYVKKSKDLGLRPEIIKLMTLGSPISAMYSIHRAFGYSESPFKAARDAITHDAIKVTNNGLAFVVEQKGNVEIINVRRMILESARMLGQALISLHELIVELSESVEGDSAPTKSFTSIH